MPQPIAPPAQASSLDSGADEDGDGSAATAQSEDEVPVVRGQKRKSRPDDEDAEEDVRPAKKIRHAKESTKGVVDSTAPGVSSAISTGSDASPRAGQQRDGEVANCVDGREAKVLDASTVSAGPSNLKKAKNGYTSSMSACTGSSTLHGAKSVRARDALSILYLEHAKSISGAPYFNSLPGATATNFESMCWVTGCPNVRPGAESSAAATSSSAEVSMPALAFPSDTTCVAGSGQGVPSLRADGGVAARATSPVLLTSKPGGAETREGMKEGAPDTLMWWAEPNSAVDATLLMAAEDEFALDSADAELLRSFSLDA